MSTFNFIVYKRLTGEIESYASTSMDNRAFHTTIETNVLEFELTDELKAKDLLKNYYVYNGEAILRPIQNTALNKLNVVADGVDEVMITDAPEGLVSIMYILNTNEEIMEGEIFGNDTFATTIPGAYYVTISAFPYLDFTATIEAI